MLMRDEQALTAHQSEPLRIANCEVVVLEVCSYLNLKEPPTPSQRQALADFLQTQFPTLSTDDVKLAFKRAASGELGFDASGFNQLSIFFWGKALSAYSNYLSQSLPKEPPAEYKGLTPDEFVATGTKAKVDALIKELADKKTAWMRGERGTAKRELGKLDSLSHREMYDQKCLEFAMINSDKFGGRDTARKAWELRIPRSRWNESKDLSWVDVELDKLAD